MSLLVFYTCHEAKANYDISLNEWLISHLSETVQLAAQETTSEAGNVVQYALALVFTCKPRLHRVHSIHTLSMLDTSFTPALKSPCLCFTLRGVGNI